MKTIETKPGVTIGFLEIRTPSTALYEYYPDKMYKIISRLSKITEEQAKELVEKTKSHTDSENVYKNYCVWLQARNSIQKSEQQCIFWMKDAISSLTSAAESLGIKESEFTNYLVVKL